MQNALQGVLQASYDPDMDRGKPEVTPKTTQRVQLACCHGVRPQRPYQVSFLSPNSILVPHVEPLAKPKTP